MIEFKQRSVILCSSPKHPVPGFAINARVTARSITDKVLHLLGNHL